MEKINKLAAIYEKGPLSKSTTIVDQGFHFAHLKCEVYLKQMVKKTQLKNLFVIMAHINPGLV